MARDAIAMVAFLVVISPLGGCSGGSRPDGPPAGPTPGVEVRTSFTASAGVLTVDYSVTNTDSVPLVVFSGVPPQETTSDHPDIDPNAVYVTPGEGTADISKRLFEVPEGIDPAAPFTMRGTVVAPGGQYAEHVVIALPLRFRAPYSGAGGSEPTLGPVRRVRFCVGVARQDRVAPIPTSASQDSDASDDPGVTGPPSATGQSSAPGASLPVFAHLNADAVQRVTCSEPHGLP
jgi:hypothetical protein